MLIRKKNNVLLAEAVLNRHFGKQQLHKLVTSSRTFPATARVDVQAALDKLFGNDKAELFGFHTQFTHETLTVAHLMSNPHNPVVIAPLQHEEIDLGEELSVRCLKQGLWLAKSGEERFAVLLSPAVQFAQSKGIHIEIAVTSGEAGARLSREVLNDIEELVKETRSYRGKVISLEVADRYSGNTGVIKVHKLRSVRREEVILPRKTLDLLDRNIGEFIKQRDKLRQLGLPIKKGLLFYGPPGTGKTHTIHYLASQLPDHTTLLVTSEQVVMLDHYFQLARFLQPAMVVIEDVDLIARAREQMFGPCNESLLNKLLNEMDGLREDTAVLFVLTTNRPESLETALASRPGRVDQAIEFPLPDDHCRQQLIRLYACGLALSDNITQDLVRKTKGASAAFIKELMRRAAQFYLQDGDSGQLDLQHVDAAMEEMLFTGGSLNAKLLGATGLAKGAAEWQRRPPGFHAADCGEDGVIQEREIEPESTQISTGPKS